MSSKVDIANLALTHIGGASRGIVSLTENTPAAIACNSFFDSCRDDVFSESQWPFASVSQPLLTAPEVVLGWTYIYAYPPKAARVWNVYNEATVNKKHEQEFEVKFIAGVNRRVICSNNPSAYADYTFKVEDTTIYDPKFVMALSYRLAAAIAFTLTGSPEVGEKLMLIYNGMLSEAKRLSGSEKIKKPEQTSSSVNSRG